MNETSVKNVDSEDERQKVTKTVIQQAVIDADQELLNELKEWQELGIADPSAVVDAIRRYTLALIDENWRTFLDEFREQMNRPKEGA